MGAQPLCFVLMPFGTKKDPTGGPDIDFDNVYESAIEPGIREADMFPIRADAERLGGIIHKPMFERLLLCDYAVADLTTANANVFYELGVRHAGRPRTTLTLFARHQPIPFDVTFLRSVAYDLGQDNCFGTAEAATLRKEVAGQLRTLRDLALRGTAMDSPLFQLLSGWKPGRLARSATDTFRDRAQLDEEYRRRLADIREKHKRKDTRERAHSDLEEFRTLVAPLDAVDGATLIDLMLTYRALEDWNGMISLVGEMPDELQRQVLVREQLGFAYNRKARGETEFADRAKATQILDAVLEEHGPSSETLGLIGRIHKDHWKRAVEADEAPSAQGHLERAIDAYRRGFMADQRDAFPGINLLTLLDIRGDIKSLEERDRLLPVVRFAVERRLVGKSPDYWDHATMVELAVLENSEQLAMKHLADAVVSIRETWEPGSTADNLLLLERARKARGLDITWLSNVIAELRKHSVSG